MKFGVHIICFTFCTMYRYLTFVKFKVPIFYEFGFQANSINIIINKQFSRLFCFDFDGQYIIIHNPLFFFLSQVEFFNLFLLTLTLINIICCRQSTYAERFTSFMNRSIYTCRVLILLLIQGESSTNSLIVISELMRLLVDHSNQMHIF